MWCKGGINASVTLTNFKARNISIYCQGFVLSASAPDSIFNFSSLTYLLSGRCFCVLAGAGKIFPIWRQLCQSPFITRPLKSSFSLAIFFSSRVNAFKTLSSPSKMKISKPLINCGVMGYSFPKEYVTIWQLSATQDCNVKLIHVCRRH